MRKLRKKSCEHCFPCILVWVQAIVFDIWLVVQSPYLCSSLSISEFLINEALHASFVSSYLPRALVNSCVQLLFSSFFAAAYSPMNWFASTVVGKSTVLKNGSGLVLWQLSDCPFDVSKLTL